MNHIAKSQPHEGSRRIRRFQPGSWRSLRWIAAGVLALVVASAAKIALAQHSVARIWDEQLLHAISQDTARPTVHARNLYHLSTAMYDAWAAYDDVARQNLHHEKATAADIADARNEAISHAAFNIIQHRFFSGPAGVGPGRDGTLADIRQQMVDLGYDPDNTSTVGDSPAALGNRVAQTVINYGLADGANEANNYASVPPYTPVNPPLTFDLPGTTMNDPNRWQQLHFLGGRIDQFGRPINESTQGNLSPRWGNVKPFGMTAADLSANGVYHDQGAPRQLGGPTDADFKQLDALGVIRLSSQLDPTDGVMLDISPATRGNTRNAPFTESYEHEGFDENPYTGQPYVPQLVRQGDFGRIVAEFWADGPRSTAPPGHWNEIANDVSDKMNQLNIAKRIGGTGPVVDELEWDVKKYLALNGAVHDAAIAAWGHKGFYDSARPISFIRYMGQLGQSSDPNLTVDLGGGNVINTYHEDGLPLEAGLVEVITPATTAAGERHEHLAGSEGKIAIRSWQGAIDGTAPFDDPSEISGVDWILAETWMPYQLSSFVTPPFPGYVSGHSTFSRSSAEVLALFTGSEFFPGGILEYEVEQGSGLDFEYGPSTPLVLQWATYFDASDQASISRVFGGIHPPTDDFTGRRIGTMVGPASFAQAVRLFNGVPEPSSVVLLVIGAVGLVVARAWRCRQ
jgi:hypothetical protein